MRRTRLVARIGLIGCLVGGLMMLGCQGPLLSEDSGRTQFDRYDQSRGNYEPQYVEDAFGRKRPNISGRLNPKD